MIFKSTFKKVVTCVAMALMFSPLSYGQLIGSDAYMIGDHVEIGINGAGGHEGAAELPGSHNRSNLVITSPVYFGFVANPQLDAWAQYDGDFFSPGTPENGFGMEIQGVNYGNNATGGPLNEIIGGLIGYEEEGDCITVEWEGVADSVRINVKYHLLTTNLFYTTEITMTNESGVDLTDVYYYRNVDPDNNVTIGGGYPTTNTIVSQADSSCQKALVSAEQDRPADAGPGVSYVGFGALGDNFRVARGGFSNRDASDIWDGVGGLTGVEGSSLFADQAIAIAYKSDIDAGESINFTFATVLSGDALEAAFEGLYYVNFESFGLSGGGVVSECSPSVDTAGTCGGNPVFLSVEGPNLDDFSWEWSPADGLSETIGTETEATPTETTTYTVTGTPIDGCLEEPIVKTIVVEYLEGPQIEITYPDSAICGEFDLTTLVYEDVNAVPGTVTYFFSEIPDSSTQTEPQWPSDFMVEGDSVYVMIADTVNGCFDYELVDIDFAEPGNAGSDTTVAYCYGTPEVLNVNDLISGDADAGGVLVEVTPSGAFDPVTGELDIAAMAPGTYEYTYTVGEEPCPMDEAVFTVIIYPELDVEVTSTDASCGEDDGTATATASGGAEPYSYEWSTGETTPEITGLAPGAYSVTVTDSNGCSVTDSVIVEGSESTLEVDKLIVNHVTCHGGSDGYIYLVIEGGVEPYTYEWSNGETTANIEDLEAGIYTVVVTDATGCDLTVEVEVTEPDPIDVSLTVDGDYICANEEGVTYQWVVCPEYVILEGETDQCYCPPFCSDREYAVIITNEDGCVDTSDCVSLEGAGIIEGDMIEINIYPNPTDGNIFIQLAGENQNIQLAVLDASGKLILQRDGISNTETIDMSAYADGVYFIRIKTDAGIVTRQITLSK